MEQRIEQHLAAGEHREALQQLATHHATAVARFCAGLVGSHAVGEELMQETFIEAWRALPGFRGDASPQAWLFGIARRICIRHLRRRDRRAGLLKRWFQPSPEAAPVPLDETLDRDTQLNRALAQLKPALRQAVLLRYQAGLDGAELAAALDVKPATARKRVSLGLQALRVTLRPLLMEPDPPADGGVAGDLPEERDHAREDDLPTPATADLRRA